jgi:hypothetical protein
MVTGVLEEPLGIQEADREQCFAQRFEQGLASPGARSAYDLCLILEKASSTGLLVRGVAGQLHKLQAPSLDQLPHPSSLVCWQAVHDHHLTLLQSSGSRTCSR